MMTMLDGVHLATVIHFPARNSQPVAERLLTILGRMSYDKVAGGGSGRETPEHLCASQWYVGKANSVGTRSNGQHYDQSAIISSLLSLPRLVDIRLWRRTSFSGCAGTHRHSELSEEAKS
jgi:hypothetical protein